MTTEHTHVWSPPKSPYGWKVGEERVCACGVRQVKKDVTPDPPKGMSDEDAASRPRVGEWGEVKE